MGADVAASLGSWRQPERVLELAHIGVAARPGTVLDEAEAALEHLGARGELIRMPELGVSSTRIRRRIAERAADPLPGPGSDRSVRARAGPLRMSADAGREAVVDREAR